MTPPVRLVFADAHPVIREGIVHFFEFLPDIDLVGAAADAVSAAEMVREREPDVVMLDATLPDLDGLELAVRLREWHPGVRVVIFTEMGEAARVRGVLGDGVNGLLSKTASPETLIEIVREVARGGTVVDPDLESYLGDLEAGSLLTRREREVLDAMALGITNKGIARLLFIAEGTVKTHVENIIQKLDAVDRTSAVAEAFRRQLIQ